MERSGDEIPERFLNKPVLHPGLQFYLDAFYDLTFDRPTGFEEGYIPLTSILAYCEFYGLNAEETEDLIYFVRQLDIAYIKDRREKSKRERERKKK